MEELAAIILTRKLLLFSLQELEETGAVEAGAEAPSWGKVEMEDREAAAYIVPVQVQAAVVCLERLLTEELDLSRQVPVQVEAVCFHQRA